MGFDLDIFGGTRKGDIEIEELQIETLNSLPLNQRLTKTNKYQGRAAQFTCSDCKKAKFAANVHILFDKDWIVHSLLCFKCHQSRQTVKKFGPVMVKKLAKRGVRV